MSMSWEMDYKRRLKLADDALAYVKSGMRVYIQPGCAEPETLVEALIRRAPELYDVEIVHMMTMGCAPYVAPEMAGHFRHNAMFIGGNVREAINDGRADYTPIYLSEIEGLIKQIGPPQWPFAPPDPGLVAQGKGIFERPTAQGGCAECHGIKPGKVRFPLKQTWATPIQVVDTDTRQYDILAWKAKSGALQGAFIPFVTDPLNETDLAFNILRTSVLGSMVDHVLSTGSASVLVSQPQANPASPAQRLLRSNGHNRGHWRQAPQIVSITGEDRIAVFSGDDDYGSVDYIR